MVNRSASLEWLRVAACLAVVVLHAAAGYIYQFGQISLVEWQFANVVDSVTRWCVPVFIMLSGAVNLHERNIAAGDFYKRRFNRLGPVIVFWSGVYVWYRHAAHDVPLTLEVVGQALLAGTPYYHLYFLFLIAGLYLITPLLSAAAVKLTGYQLFISGMVLTLVAMFAAGTGGAGVNVFSRFAPYVGYYILGAALVRLEFSPRAAALTFAVSVGATAVGTWSLVEHLGIGSRWALYLYSYLSPTVIPMSIAAFVLGLSLFRGEAGPILRRISGLTMGVYLLHLMVLEPISWWLPRIGLAANNAIIDLPIQAALASLITFLLVGIGARIPGIRSVLI